MIRQIFINDQPQQLFTNKVGIEFKMLVNDLLTTNKEIKEQFNECKEFLTIGLVSDLEVFVWGDEDSKTFELKEVDLI